MINFFEVKAILLNKHVRVFFVEKIIDIIEVCKYIMTGSYAQNKEDIKFSAKQ